MLDPRVINQFYAEIDRRVDERVALALTRFSTNYRPRGAASLPLTVGAPGTSLTTGLWVNGAKVPFPMTIDHLHIVADAATDTQFDLQVQRPSVAGKAVPTVADALSIVNDNYPELVDVSLAPVQEIIITPCVAPLTTPPVWSSIYLEGGSLLYLYVLATDGAADVVTFNIVGRCV